MIIENVDWQITSRCNRNCPYCFGPLNIDEISLVNMYKIIDKMAKNGTKQLGITGGEPLEHPFISEIINYSVELGIKIYLSTNCDYYYKYSDLIKEKVSILGIPIDGANEKTHDLHRGNQSFKAIIEAANDIYNSDCKTKIKFGTVVTKFNYNQLLDIEKLISKYTSKIIFWKLYELISYERNQKNVEQLKNIAEPSVLGKYLDSKKIIFDSINKRDRSYFFIKPNGDVFIPYLNNKISNEELIGNLLNDDYEDILSNFKKNVNTCGYFEKYRYMKV